MVLRVVRLGGGYLDGIADGMVEEASGFGLAFGAWCKVVVLSFTAAG